MNIVDKFHACWNIFTNRDPTIEYDYQNLTYGSSYRPDRPKLSRGHEKSIAVSVFNRISIDVSSLTIKHCKVDKNNRYLEDVHSGLNRCLTIEANKDQTGSSFIQDVVLSMLDEGCVAIVPVDTEITIDGRVEILSLRTGKIIEWFPDKVLVELYNDQNGRNENIYLNKKDIGIVENPFYAVINEPNSTLQRLIRKLILLDSVDNQSSSGKLDLIVQLPYVIRSEARRKEAIKRKQELEQQLNGSKYGIAYIDGTEKVTQLNRSVENNLMKQIEYLTSMLYSQLSITTSVLDGTADEKTMLNYYNRTVEPILSCIVNELKRKFLNDDIENGKSLIYFRDPFKMLTLDNVAQIADKLVRNEVATKNEIRQVIGLPPSDDPKADELSNPNMPHEKEDTDVSNQ